jgi:Predicted 3'-5' exonuclease related to the exonuclease domain of PolB
MNNRIIWDIETMPLPEDQLIKPEFTAKESAWRDGLALDATTGRVAMIGLLVGDDEPDIFSGDEKAILNSFWDSIQDTAMHDGKIVGFNSNNFDLPFLLRRSWANNVRVPDWVRKGRYFADNFVDLLEVWSCSKREQTISLANLCRFLGVGEKTGNGADFYLLTRKQQKKYLELDLKLTKTCADILL